MEKRESTCLRSSTLGPQRDNFLSTFTPTPDSFALDNRYIAFMGCSIDNPRAGAAGGSVLQEAPLHSPGTLPVRPPQKRETQARHPHYDSSFMRRGFTQLLERTYRRLSSSRFSAPRPSKLGMKNMFLVEDLQAVPEEASSDALSSPARMLPTRSHHSSRQSSPPRQRRFAVAPHVKSPSPAPPTRETEENARFVPSSGTLAEVDPYPSSSNSPVARKGVVSFGRELASLLRTVMGLLERMKEVRPREKEAPGRSSPRQATAEFLPPKSSECQEDEVDVVDSVMAIRNLVERVEREFVSLKSQIGVQ
ncbi:hypothetical protein TRSC58_03640 [Trypanosoma rangeli SC58]|uniref:Uncharacterized protein n=1 Tax=Trypanosoma rangeli SC58 TaxID=429131 RepID=A0A061J148_TRYRA|nr:hypothetical protein TRSC58_03640 [Trypanosoma rangeli SC58]